MRFHIIIQMLWDVMIWDNVSCNYVIVILDIMKCKFVIHVILNVLRCNYLYQWLFCSDVKVDNRSAELMSNDMHKEMLRQKWEEEELAAMNQPIHYANVQYDGKMEVDSAVYLFSKHFLFCISWISYCNSLNWSTFYFYRYVFNSFTQQSNISFIQMLTPSLLELHQRKQICVHAFHLPRTERNNGALVDLIHIKKI